MVKNIDLDNLMSKGLVVEIFNIDVDNKYVDPNFPSPREPAHFKKIPFKKGDSQFEITFELQTYQELGLKEGDIATFGSNQQRWRVVEVSGSTVSFGLA